MSPQKKDYQQVGPKIRRHTADWYKALFPNLNTGVTFTLESMPDLHKTALSEIRGVFEKLELMLMLDATASTTFPIEPDMAGRYLRFSMSDALELDVCGEYDCKRGVHKKTFLKKLQSLTRFQACCLEMRIAACCQNMSDNNSYEDFFQDLLTPDQIAEIAD